MKLMFSFLLLLGVTFSSATFAVMGSVPNYPVWYEASTRTNLSVETIYAMALAESGKTIDGQFIPHPYAIALGVDESVGQYKHEGFYPDTLEEAQAILTGLLNAGYKNIGIGIMQINFRENSHLVDDPLVLLDPVVNLETSLLVINQCRKGSTYDRILSCYSKGRYESDEGKQYANKVRQYEQDYAYNFVYRYQPRGELTISILKDYYKDYYQSASASPGEPTVLEGQ